MITAILAAVLFTANGTDFKVRGTFPANAKYLDGRGTLCNVAAAPRNLRELCGWYDLEDVRPVCADDEYAAFIGYERTETGYRKVYEVRKIEPEPEEIED